MESDTNVFEESSSYFLDTMDKIDALLKECSDELDGYKLGLIKNLKSALEYNQKNPACAKEIGANSVKFVNNMFELRFR